MRVHGFILAVIGTLLFAAPAAAQTRLDMLASVLPTHRSAVKDGTVSFFATVLNASTTDTLTNCKPVFTADQGAQNMARQASFTFQTVDGANVLTGTPNTAIDIPPSTFQGFVFGVDGKIQNPGSFFTSDLSVRFQCDNGIPQENVYLNTASVFVSDAKSPVDALSIAQTPSADGIVRINAAGGAEAFAVAATNLGAGGAENVVVTPTLEVPVDSADASRATKLSNPFRDVASLSICETNAVTGACLSAPTPSVVASLGAGISTFSVFITANVTTGIGLVPQWLRVTVNFVPQNAATNEIAGRTSVALTAPGSPLGAPQNFAELPAGLYAVRMRPNGDATASSIMDGEMLVIDRSAVAVEKPETGSASGRTSRPEAESDETGFEALGFLMEQLITDVDGSIMEVGPNASGLGDFTFRVNEPIRHQDDGKQVADAKYVLPPQSALRSRLYSGQNFSTIRDFNNRANRGNETVLTHQIKSGADLKTFTAALGTSISANGEIFAVLKDPASGANIGDFNLSQLVGTQSNSLSFSATENCTMTIDEAPADFTNNFALFVVTLTTNQILGGRCPQVGRYNLFLYASVFSKNIFGNPNALEKFYFTALFVGRPFSATAGKGQVMVGEFDPAAQ